MDELKSIYRQCPPPAGQGDNGYLGIPLGNCEVCSSANENTFVRVLENVRERDVFIVQPISSPVNTLDGTPDYDRCYKTGFRQAYYSRHALLRLRAAAIKKTSPVSHHRPALSPTCLP